MLHEFDEDTAEAIRASLPEDLLAHVDSGSFRPTQDGGGRHWAPEPDAAPETDPVGSPAGAGASAPWWAGSRGDE
jgi:hypothetical protein